MKPRQVKSKDPQAAVLAVIAKSNGPISWCAVNGSLPTLENSQVRAVLCELLTSGKIENADNPLNTEENFFQISRMAA